MSEAHSVTLLSAPSPPVRSLPLTVMNRNRQIIVLRLCDVFPIHTTLIERFDPEEFSGTIQIVSRSENVKP